MDRSVVVMSWIGVMSVVERSDVDVVKRSAVLLLWWKGVSS